MSNNTITAEQIAAGAAVLNDDGKPVGRNTAVMVWDAMSGAATSGDAPDLQKLKRLALQAGGGKWIASGPEFLADSVREWNDSHRTVAMISPKSAGTEQASKEMCFIAAASPSVVLDLIARIERAASPATASGDDLPHPWRDRLVNGTFPAPGQPGYWLTGASAELAARDAEIADLRAAVSAATKPTADLSKLLADIESIADELDADAMNYEGDFADTVKGCSEALRKLADVQSLLATKPAAPAVPEKLTRSMCATKDYCQGWNDCVDEALKGSGGASADEVIEARGQARDFTEEEISTAGRALADRNATLCNVNKDDNWKIYGEEFITDARVALDAIAALCTQDAGAEGADK